MNGERRRRHEPAIVARRGNDPLPVEQTGAALAITRSLCKARHGRIPPLERTPLLIGRQFGRAQARLQDPCGGWQRMPAQDFSSQAVTCETSVADAATRGIASPPFAMRERRLLLSLEP